MAKRFISIRAVRLARPVRRACAAVLICTLLIIRISQAADPLDWLSVTEGPFTFEYPPMARKAVRYLRSMCPLLEKRIKEDLSINDLGTIRIVVVTNNDQFLMHQPAGIVPPVWAAGVAYPSQGLVIIKSPQMLVGAQYDFEKVFFHEVAHVALHRIFSPDRAHTPESITLTHDAGEPPTSSLPRWLHEGYALFLARQWSFDREITLGKAVIQNRLIPLGNLVSDFPRDRVNAEIAYAQSADLVHFLRHRYGALAFRAFISALGKEHPFGKALRVAFGVSFQELEDTWRQHLRRRYHVLSALGSMSLVGIAGSFLLVAAYVRKRLIAKRITHAWLADEENRGRPPIN